MNNACMIILKTLAVSWKDTNLMTLTPLHLTLGKVNIFVCGNVVVTQIPTLENFHTENLSPCDHLSQILPLRFLDIPLLCNAEAPVPYWAGPCRCSLQPSHRAPSVYRNDDRSFVAWSTNTHTQIQNVDMNIKKQRQMWVHTNCRDPDSRCKITQRSVGEEEGG